MSGIYGAFNRQDGSVEGPVLEKMHKVFSQWFDDGSGRWLQKSVGLGHTARFNTTETPLVILPLVDETCDTALVVTCDVRLDNASQLADELGLVYKHDFPDAAKLLLAAYRNWGENCAEHLLGDFSFAIWDGMKEQLFCARDHVGVRPFYYSASSEAFFFANDIEPILSVNPRPSPLSAEALANYTTYADLGHPTATFFEDIKKLPPGHTLLVTASSLDVACYWHPESVAPRTEASECDLVSEFQDLLEDAIIRRAASKFPVGAHLSGGLDSSVVSIAAARSLDGENGPLHAYNWIRPPQEGQAEEGPDYEVARRLASAEGIEYHTLDFSAEDMSHQILNHDISFNDTAMLRFEPFVRELAKSHGVRTMLSGWGGDQFASYPGGYPIASAFWHGRLLFAFRALYKSALDQPIMHRPWVVLKRLVSQVFLPVLPDRLHRWIIGDGYDEKDYSFVLSKAWREKVHDLKPKRAVYSRLDSRLHRFQMLTDGMITARLESWAAGGMRCGIDYRFPLLDKRVIEFSLGTPVEFFSRNGARRYLFRAASTRWLSQADAWRPDTKSEPNRIRQLVSLEKVLLSLWANRLDMLRFDDTTLIDAEVARSLLKKLSSFSPTEDHSELDEEYTALLLTIFLSKLPVSDYDRI
ncbi:MAG: asparagine synthase-related protein [Halioglobus sp.]